MARAVYSSGPDPRLDYPAGYGWGEALVRLSQLLRQGTDSYQRQQTVDEESQRRNQDYLLRLRQLMDQEQERPLDRAIKQQTADTQRLQIQSLIDQRTAAAQQAAREAEARGQYGVALGTPETTQTDAPQPPAQATALSPQAEDRTFGQFIYGKRKRTPREALEAMGPAAANLPKDFFETMVKLYPEKKPAEPKYQQFDPTKPISRIDESGVTDIRPGTPGPEKPFAEGKTPAELEVYIADPSTPPDKRRIAQDALKAIRGADLTHQVNAASLQADIQNQMLDARDLKARRLKADEASAELAQVDKIMGRMDAAVPKVNTPGLLGRVAGLTTRKLEEFAQTNPDINELAALGEGYVSVIAKIVQRQSGILSNQDLDRATKSVPLIGDTLEVAQRKLAVLHDILNTAKANIAVLRGDQPPASPSAASPPASPRSEADRFLKDKGLTP